MKTFTFDELLKKREQREADQCRIGQIPVPESGRSLEARMPDKREVLSLYGEFAGASGPLDALEVGKHALYACCPQLQDKALQQTLGTEQDPMRTLDELFTVRELDAMGGEALRVLRLLPEEKKDGGEEPPAAGEAVKN